MSYFLYIGAFYFIVVQFLNLVLLVFELVIGLSICLCNAYKFLTLRAIFSMIR
jgi:hypothetical protein